MEYRAQSLENIKKKKNPIAKKRSLKEGKVEGSFNLKYQEKLTSYGLLKSAKTADQWSAKVRYKGKCPTSVPKIWFISKSSKKGGGEKQSAQDFFYSLLNWILLNLWN